MHAILDDSILLAVEGSEKFMLKLTEADLLEERQEGRAEGKAEGIAEGIAEGKAKGKAEGIVEGFETALAVARGLMRGISPKQLATEYNRPIEDIEKLQQELLAV